MEYNGKPGNKAGKTNALDFPSVLILLPSTESEQPL